MTLGAALVLRPLQLGKSTSRAPTPPRRRASPGPAAQERRAASASVFAFIWCRARGVRARGAGRARTFLPGAATGGRGPLIIAPQLARAAGRAPSPLLFPGRRAGPGSRSSTCAARGGFGPRESSGMEKGGAARAALAGPLGLLQASRSRGSQGASRFLPLR